MKRKQIRAMATGVFLGVAISVVVMLLSGCATAPIHTAGPAVITDIRDSSLEASVVPWQIEVARRFPHAVMFMCHGGSITRGQWLLLDNPDGHYGETAEPVDVVLRKLRAEYPARQIVLIACNPQHYAIHGYPGCWYFESSVWVVPDRAVPTFSTGDNYTLDGVTDEHPNDIRNRSEQQPDVVGNIYEAVSAE